MADREGLIHRDGDMRAGCTGWVLAFCPAPLRNYLQHERDGEEGEVAEAGWRAYLPAFCRLPLHEHAVAKVVDLLSHVFVVASGIAATYLLAGGERGSACYPSVVGPLPLTYQAMIACLPFITFPLAVVLGGQLKTYIDQGRPSRLISTISLLQAFVVVFLASWVMVCFTSASTKAVVTGFACLALIMALSWGCMSGCTERLMGRGDDAGEQ